VVIALIVVGLLLWLLEQLPIDAKIKQIIRVVVIVFVVIWVVYLLAGLISPGPSLSHRFML
jgi:hypothetical protein